MNLNNTTCKNATGFTHSKSPRKLSDGNGLYLWVYCDASKRWRFHYSLHGHKKLVSLGVYPEVSLKEARDKAFEARKMVSEGIDPAIEKKKQKLIQFADHRNTFEAVTMRWFKDRQSSLNMKYQQNILRRLEVDILPHIGKLPIKDITPALLLNTIRKIETRGATDLAKRQLQKCSEIFSYAISEGLLENDPSLHVGKGLKPSKGGHHASITIEEIPIFLASLEQNKPRFHLTTYHALKLMMLTFLRTSEFIGAKWNEIDFINKRWDVPADRMKMKRPHFVPLSEQTIEILKAQHEITGHREFIFASSINGRKSISNNTILGALNRMGYKGRMTGHGFRALAMSAIMQELNYRFEIPDLQLAHVKQDKIRQAYDRADFKEERFKMMQDWADYLERHGLRK